MKNEYLNDFEIKVVEDIRKNEGKALKSIVEQNFYEYSEYENAKWMYDYVYSSICLKLFKEVERLLLNQFVVEEQNKNIQVDKISKWLCDAVYMKIKYLDEERLEEKIKNNSEEK